MTTDTSGGKRRRGQVNGTQSLIYSIYRSAIRNILELEPSGLNVSQITSRVPEMRNRLVKQPDFKLTPEQLRKLPDEATSDRKVIRKHLLQMWAMGQVRYVDGMYYPIVREEPEIKELRHALYLPLAPPMSKALIEMTNETLSAVEPQDWRFPLLENGAIFRTYVNPAKFRNRFDDFFGKFLQDFKNDIFFLDELLEHAIAGGLSPKFYNPTTGSVNMRLLREGWERYFEDTKAMVWVYAINPREFLHFIETYGQAYVKERNWDKILARGRKRRADIRAMERTKRKIEKQLELMRLRHNAEIQSRADAGRGAEA
jgi:hypothetical protein